MRVDIQKPNKLASPQPQETVRPSEPSLVLNKQSSSSAAPLSDIQYDELYLKFQAAQSERDEIARELQRIRDKKNNGGSSGARATHDEKKASGGFLLSHLLIVGVLFLIIGALLARY